MDFLLVLKAIVMGIVEGITELLPISSTGHLILAGELMDFLEGDKRVVFEIFIQMGAMLAVVWEYRVKLINSVLGVTRPGMERNLFVNIAIAFFPTAIIGYLFSDYIMGVLFNPYVVAAGFAVGGLIIIWVEKRPYSPTVVEMDNLSYLDAFKVGLCQCAALIPGTSRSGATIIGGIYFGLSRKAATEFSFFLAIPMIGVSSIYSLWKVRDNLDSGEFGILAVGFVTAFITTFLIMKALLKFISNHTYIAFAWYRIAFAVLILATAYTGVIDWSL
jgi:undecaprenyl-diphosphatase